MSDVTEQSADFPRHPHGRCSQHCVECGDQKSAAAILAYLAESGQPGPYSAGVALCDKCFDRAINSTCIRCGDEPTNEGSMMGPICWEAVRVRDEQKTPSGVS